MRGRVLYRAAGAASGTVGTDLQRTLYMAFLSCASRNLLPPRATQRMTRAARDGSLFQVAAYDVTPICTSLNTSSPVVFSVLTSRHFSRCVNTRNAVYRHRSAFFDGVMARSTCGVGHAQRTGNILSASPATPVTAHLTVPAHCCLPSMQQRATAALY